MAGTRTMKRLTDNAYNRRVGRSDPKLKRWRYAGLMLTYQCPAQCALCYDNCGPDGGGLLDIETALDAWRSLCRLAEDSARVHITGGEPFTMYDYLVELLARAQAEGLGGLEDVETNAYWAHDAAEVRHRLQALDRVGLRRLKISCDPFHAEYIAPDRVRLLASVAREVLGPERVLVRWEKYLQAPVSFTENAAERQCMILAAVVDAPCRFTGRAAHEVAPWVAARSPDTWRGHDCRREILGAKGVHVDPYGHVFSGLCSGIILGNVKDQPLDVLWEQFDPRREDLLGALFEGGPARLLESAVAAGYATRPRYADKCHLCTDVRQFFFDTGRHREIIGPCDCYLRRHAASLREVGIVEG